MCCLLWPYAHTKLPKIQQVIQHYAEEKLKKGAKIIHLADYKDAKKTYTKEIAFIRNLYSDTVSRQTKPTRREKIVDVEMNVDEFVQHWKNQKKRFGLQCPYTYKTMTTIQR